MIMKRKISIFDVILFGFIIAHILYTIYMFTQSIMSGVIWLVLTLFEIVLLFLGIKYSRGLLMAMVIIILIQGLLSLSILMMGSDRDSDDAEYALVLGYALKDNAMQETLKLRLDGAYEYAINNPKAKLVLCGGKTAKNKVSEAEVMYNYLRDKGLSDSRMLKEDKSQDTIENIQNSLNYINRYAKITVISSDYHVYRAKLICNKLGLDVHTLGTYSPLKLLPHALLIEKAAILQTIIFMH